jgi:hypothetical protein
MMPIRAASAGGSGAQPDRSSTHFVRLIANAADHVARMTEKQTPKKTGRGYGWMA